MASPPPLGSQVVAEVAGRVAGVADQGGVAGVVVQGGVAGVVVQGGVAGAADQGGVAGVAGQGGVAGVAGLIIPSTLLCRVISLFLLWKIRNIK
jgi:hypothetical protein